MYARLVQKLPQGNVWLYEVKLDGYAALAGRDATRVTLWSRRGNLFTAQFPQIARACERLSPSSLLDGEIVALDESGGIYCNITVQSAGVALLRIRRAIGSWPKPAEHAAFQRPETLGEIFKGIKGAPHLRLRDPQRKRGRTGPGRQGVCLRGIVAKRKDSLYESGKRTSTWVKYKVNRRLELVISGYTPGNPFDALIVGYYEGDRLLYAAKVRNGFVPQVRREVASKFKGLEIDTCPFVNLPEKKRTLWALTKEEMKNRV
jgi:ATP-dependent DNA ligase